MRLPPSLLLLPLLLLSSAAVGQAQRPAESGYLLPVPSPIIAGASYACANAPFHLFNFAGPGRQLKLRFVETKLPPPSPGEPLDPTFLQLFSVTRNVSDAKGATTTDCLPFTVPINITSFAMHGVMELGDSSGVVFTERQRISVMPHMVSTLVATDKARYLTGETVFFQIVSLELDLRPVSHLVVPEIWITSPAGIRVAQWRNQPATHGMIQLSLPLAEETPLGVWKIHIKSEHSLLDKEFTVEEFTSRVFRVDVRSPKRFSPGQRTLTVDVCARYVFEKPVVSADVTINVTATLPWGERSKVATGHSHTNSSGCATVDMVAEGDNFRYRFDHLEVNVTVVDPASGDTETRLLKITQDANAARLTLLRTRHLIQPNIPYFVQYRAKRRDDTLAVNETVTICTQDSFFHPKRTSESRVTNSSLADYTYMLPKEILNQLSASVKEELNAIPLLWQIEEERPKHTSSCREVLTDHHGIAKLMIPPPNENVYETRITARMPHASSSEHFTLLTSPSHSYLSIDTSQLPVELPCSGEVDIRLLASFPDELPAYIGQLVVRIQVMVQNRVMETRQLVYEGGPMKLSLTMKPEMSPSIKLLAYAVLPSGEVISDSHILDVTKCFSNKVEVRWNTPTGHPGDQAVLSVTADPRSRCHISVADIGTELNGTDHQITQERWSELLEMSVIRVREIPKSFEEYCQGLQTKMFRILKRAGVSDASLQGLLKGFNKGIESDQRSRTSFQTYHSDSRSVFRWAGLQTFSNIGVDVRPCVKRERLPFGSRGRRSVRRHDGYLYSSRPTPAGGAQYQANDRVVSRAETLLSEAVTIGEHGTYEKAITLPGKPTSWTAYAVCVHPEHGLGISEKVKLPATRQLLTTLALPYSVKRGEVVNMSVGVFNHYDSDLSVHLQLEPSRQYRLSDATAASEFELCIHSGLTEVVHVPLEFLELGEVPVRVTAHARDGNCPQYNTVHPPSDQVVKPVLVKSEGFAHDDTTSRFVCLDPGVTRSVEVDLPRPDGLIPGSERVYVSVFGDMLGPSMLDLDDELAFPSGGGEPNLLKFVPNIHIHEYLLATGLMTKRLRDRTTNNMLSGYQRQLRYRRSDGSFSAYGNEDEDGSLWLTAFTIKSFKEAARFISVDLDALAPSVAWVLRHQQPDGCFRPVGELLHTDLRGGVEREHTGALTAYVILALHDVIEDYRLADGLRCMNYYATQPDASLFTKILVTHTYIQLGLEAKARYLLDALLKEATREGEQILYWRGARQSIYGGRTAADLEMTSYMTLSLLKLSGMKYMETAAKAVNWIISKRDTFFKSSQAAVASLQALSAMSRRTYSSEAQSRVSVRVRDAPPFWVSVNAQNRLLQQRYKVKNLQLPTRVRLTVNQGCVVLMTSLRYSSFLEVPHPAFSLSVISTERQSRYPGSSYELRACANYIGSADQSDRAVLTVELPSGFIAVSSSLRKLRDDRVIRSFKVDEDRVELTVLNITHQKKCLSFRILREAEVEQLKPSLVTLHDFYEPQERARQEYTI